MKGFGLGAQCCCRDRPQTGLRQVDSGGDGSGKPFQSNRLETDSSAAVRLMASPISVAIGSTRILLDSVTACVGWIESVITNSLRLDLPTRATAPPESTPWVM